MLNKTIVLLALILAVNIVHSQDLLCGSHPYEPACVATSAFSVDNVHRVRSMGLQEADVRPLEASWNKTELILVTLGDIPEDIPARKKNLKYLDFYPFEYTKHKGYFSRGKFLAQDETFSQLAVTSDTVVVGTNTGSLLFWNFRQESLLSTAPSSHDWTRYEQRMPLPPAIPVSNGEISEILTHPSDEWLLVVIDYSRVFRVDLESKSVTEIEFQAGEDQALKALAFSDDGLWLAAADNESIRIWNTASWAAWEPKDLSAKSVKKLLFTADDSQLIVLADASVSRWSLSSGRLNFVRELAAYPGKRPCRINDGDISPDGSLLMTADDCGQNRAWDLTVDQEVFIPQLDFAEWGGTIRQFSSDGFYLFGGFNNVALFSILIIPSE